MISSNLPQSNRSRTISNYSFYLLWKCESIITQRWSCFSRSFLCKFFFRLFCCMFHCDFATDLGVVVTGARSVFSSCHLLDCVVCLLLLINIYIIHPKKKSVLRGRFPDDCSNFSKIHADNSTNDFNCHDECIFINNHQFLDWINFNQLHVFIFFNKQLQLLIILLKKTIFIIIIIIISLYIYNWL